MTLRRIPSFALVVLLMGALVVAASASTWADRGSGSSGSGSSGSGPVGSDSGDDDDEDSGDEPDPVPPPTTPLVPAAPPPPPAPAPAPPPAPTSREPSGPSAPSASGTCDTRSGPLPTSGATRRNLHQVPSASSRTAYPCPYPPEWRGIRLGLDDIRLVVGGELVRQIPFAARGRAIGLPEITEAIDDPSWLEEVSPGIFELRATLVQSAGTALAVQAPRVTMLRLADRLGVALAGSGALATFDGVVVTSWNEWLQIPDEGTVEERPYVVYSNGSRLDISRSTFQYLGSDRTSSYGVTWRHADTTGTVTSSIFDHNFFGIYTFEASNMRIEGNEVSNSTVYGIDPHDASTALVIAGNDVHDNGSHGIIFSKFVHDSVVIDNFSHDNAGNGIMMDFHSDRNLIEANTVTNNAGEGIVASSSADLTIRANRVSGSEVGVRISHAGADRVTVEGNELSDVETGVKIYDLPVTPVVRANKISRATVAGVRIDSPGATFADNRMHEVRVGYDARTATMIEGGTVIAKERALDVASTGTVTVRGAELVSRDVGIRVAQQGEVIRKDTDVTVRDRAEGDTTGRTFSFIGIVLVLTALLLQGVHAVRNRHWSRSVPAPVHVRNLS